jgi:hypothetical protein
MDVERSAWAWSAVGILALLILHFLLHVFYAFVNEHGENVAGK